MFTGIVEEMGTVEAISSKKNLSVLKVRAKKVLGGTAQGTSISVNGVCLTVTKRKKDILEFDIMLETLLKTNLGTLKPKGRVNLERAMKANGRIDGHFVSGHVDDMGRIKAKITGENYTELQISTKRSLMKYIAPKGSVCVDGVSMTIGEVRKNTFSIYLIPFTLEVTTLGRVNKGDKINIETDILAKYILNSKK
ncbi:MAG: riboflavin synthase [Candidatus Omnitrophica bacterium]|nr:riboflavin synthase [Candidatus Omnitrophota bacterium]MCK5259939.1 riboflavin synthase [Candidatus Omnitrophota bacterium]